jgi:hypothetical protein
MRFVPDVPEQPDMPVVWQVCFADRVRRAPWDWICPQNYRHAFLLGYLPGLDRWLCYDVLFFKTEITVLPGALAGRLLTTAQRQGGVLNWPAPGALKASWWPRFGFWCVPAIKHVLGLRCVAMTPKGLHDWMVRHGARPLVEESHVPIQHPESPGGRPGG